jgi:sulfate transport system permease protein
VAGRTFARASSTPRTASSSTSRTSWEFPLSSTTDAVRLPARAGKSRRAGGLVLGLSTAYLTLIVLIPIAAVVASSLEGGLSAFWDEVTGPAALAALKLTFVASLVVVLVNAITGTLIAWVLVRDEFRGKSIVNAIIDLPFALPTIVAGLTLLAVYGPRSPLGFDVAYTRAAVVLALAFVTLPFVVRAVQPVLMELDREMEEAAASLGARPFTTFRRIILPNLMPAVLSGAALSFGKAVGEFGSVVLISGNIPFDTEVASVHIFKLIESGEPEAAAAVSVVLLVASFIVLAVADVLERRSRRHDA